MPDAATDIQAPISLEREFAGRIALVVHWQQRRRQERRLALAAMRVAAEDPALEAVPDRDVDGIRIMAEHDRRASWVELPQRVRRTELVGPEVVEPGELQPFHVADIVAQHRD